MYTHFSLSFKNGEEGQFWGTTSPTYLQNQLCPLLANENILGTVEE